MKKFLSVWVALLLLAGIFSFSAAAGFDSGTVTNELRSKVYYMENMDEGTVFFEKDSDEKIAPAGFTKVVAAIVVLESWRNLDEAVRVTEKNLNVFEYEYGMITALYEAGESVSKRELFNCILVYSANDALSIAASEIAGTEEAFLEKMQSLVNKIGCTSTVFKNLHGFDAEGQYTTARDVAKIIRYGLNYPAFAEAFSAGEITLKATKLNEERTYYSSNRMLEVAVADYYHSSVTGGKQTSTEQAGECIAAVSSADGYSYLTVVMGGTLVDIDDDDVEENTSMTDAQRMLDWVYENIRYKVVVSPEQVVGEVGVVAGKDADKLKLVPEKETSALVPSKASPEAVMFEIQGEKIEKIYAPVEEGEIIAKADVYYAGQKITTVNLVACESIKLSFGGFILVGFRGLFGSAAFLVLSLLCALAAVLYFAYCLQEYIVCKDPARRKQWEEKKAAFNNKKKGLFKKKPKKKAKAANSAPKRRAPSGAKLPVKGSASNSAVRKKPAPSGSQTPKKQVPDNKGKQNKSSARAEMPQGKNEKPLK